MVISEEEIKMYKDVWYQKNKERIKLRRKEYEQRLEVKARIKKYCQSSVYKEKRKVYRDDPKNKVKAKKYDQEYNQRPKVIARRNELRNRPEAKAKMKINREKPEVKAKRKVYVQEYDFNPKNKRRRNKRRKQHRMNNKTYRFIDNLRSNLYLAFKYCSKNGKIMNSREYGIDYKKIIEHLKPFPKYIENYHIDHIIPLSWFDHNNPDEVKWCWSKDNLQWLRKELNLWKHNKFILPLSIKEQDVLMKKMFPHKVKSN